MRVFSLFPMLFVSLLAGVATAQLAPVDANRLGFAQNKGLLFVEPGSVEMVSLVDTAFLIGFIMIVICIFVLGLLIWVAVRYNARVNTTPSRTTHSTILEILWTGIPTLIVIFIGFLGVRQVIELERTPTLGIIAANGSFDTDDAILSIDIHGMSAWNWDYDFLYFGDEVFAAENPEFYNLDQGQGILVDGYRFTSTMLEHPEFEKRELVPESERESVLATWEQLGRDLDFYQFDVDNRLVIPSSVRVQVNVRGAADADKQHAWAVPALGVKRDFWPGRVNSTHFLVPEGNEGLYFGQCSEFCGPNHAFMPIVVHVVTLDEFRSYFALQMTKALAVVESGGLFEPDYLPVHLPSPFGLATIAQR